jgi:hypothetical protein
VSKPYEAGELPWKEPSPWMGTLHWDRSIGGREAGPEWTAKATDIISYKVWAERTLHEDWRGDFYEYEFDAMMIANPKPTSRNRGQKLERRTEALGHTDTLAEAQKLCEDHFQENF